MDKLGTKIPLADMTRPQLEAAVQECRQAFNDYRFTAEQKIKDMQGWIDSRIEADRIETDLGEGSQGALDAMTAVQEVPNELLATPIHSR